LTSKPRASQALLHMQSVLRVALGASACTLAAALHQPRTLCPLRKPRATAGSSKGLQLLVRAAQSAHMPAQMQAPDSLVTSPSKRHVPPNTRTAELFVADVVSGREVGRVEELAKASRDWRLAHVVSYRVSEPERQQCTMARPRPFHKDYRHYKYYGARAASSGVDVASRLTRVRVQALRAKAPRPAGPTTRSRRCASLSLLRSAVAHRQSESQSTPAARRFSGQPSAVKDAPQISMPPLDAFPGGPRRPLTSLEGALITSFKGHVLGERPETAH